MHTVNTKHERRTCDGLAIRGNAAQKVAWCGSDGKLIWDMDVRWNQSFDTSKVRRPSWRPASVRIQAYVRMYTWKPVVRLRASGCWPRPGQAGAPIRRPTESSGIQEGHREEKSEEEAQLMMMVRCHPRDAGRAELAVIVPDGGECYESIQPHLTMTYRDVLQYCVASVPSSQWSLYWLRLLWHKGTPDTG